MSFSIGSTLGPYEIVALTGAAGMGMVYRARDRVLRREVAIKVLKPPFSCDPEWLHRLLSEAQTLAALNHPNILTVFDFGEHVGLPYIVTELLDGETLREQLHTGAFQVQKSTGYAEQIASGLMAAHDKGIVHCDLKPENVFIERNGWVKILDFGLAKVGRMANDHAGLLAGTPGYMSPEQILGEGLDCRTDIFSFGAILYEMLAGKPAFQRATLLQTVSATLHDDPPALDISHPISSALDSVVRRCLEKDPKKRFQSARDITENLAGFSRLSATVSPL